MIFSILPKRKKTKMKKQKKKIGLNPASFVASKRNLISEIRSFSLSIGTVPFKTERKNLIANPTDGEHLTHPKAPFASRLCAFCPRYVKHFPGAIGRTSVFR